jgi:hypothetical protein
MFVLLEKLQIKFSIIVLKLNKKEPIQFNYIKEIKLKIFYPNNYPLKSLFLNLIITV